MTTIEVVRSSSRLVADASSPPSLEFHERRHGALPGPVGDRTSWGLGLVEEIERAGLTGRGGGGFASFKKMRLALSARRAPVLVANGMEGEPASEKDSFLLMRAPHLVLDGVELVAAALGCTRTVLCIPKHAGSIAALVGQAQKERSASGYSPRESRSAGCPVAMSQARSPPLWPASPRDRRSPRSVRTSPSLSRSAGARRSSTTSRHWRTSRSSRGTGPTGSSSSVRPRLPGRALLRSVAQFNDRASSRSRRGRR